MPRPLNTGPTRQFIAKLVPPGDAVASTMVFEPEPKNGSEMPEGRPPPHLFEYDPSVEAEQRDEIVKELGAPFQVTRSGYTINQPFFARIWGTYRLALYDQTSGSFYHYFQL
jgi:hypothetical protein